MPMGPSVLMVESGGRGNRRTLGIGVEDKEASKIDFSTEIAGLVDQLKTEKR